MINSFEYYSPKSIDEYIEVIKENSIILAGGSDLIPLMKFEVKNPERIIDIQYIDEINRIKVKDNFLEIGAGVKLNELVECEFIRDMFPALHSATKAVASPQIRSIGTIGGNIMQDRRCIYFNQSYNWRSSINLCYKTGGSVCHQAPASENCRAIYYSDIATALYVLDTKVEVLCEGNRNVIDITKFCELHGVKNGELSYSNMLITKFLIPTPEYSFNRFIKKSVRNSIDFPTFNAAINIKNNIEYLEVQLAVGAINKNPILLNKTSKVIEEIKCYEIEKHFNEIREIAINEIVENFVPIKEPSISLKVKKSNFIAIDELLKDVLYKK